MRAFETLSATPRVAAVYRRPEEYRANDTGLVILDRFIPPQRPQADSLWIDPPAMGSPVPVRTTVDQVAFSHWDTEHPGAAGLHTKDFKLSTPRSSKWVRVTDASAKWRRAR